MDLVESQVNVRGPWATGNEVTSPTSAAPAGGAQLAAPGGLVTG